MFRQHVVVGNKLIAYPDNSGDPPAGFLMIQPGTSGDTSARFFVYAPHGVPSNLGIDESADGAGLVLGYCNGPDEHVCIAHSVTGASSAFGL